MGRVCMDVPVSGVCCILAAGSRPMVSISNFWAISYCRPLVTLWRSLLFWGLTFWENDVLSRLLSGAAPTVGGAFIVTLAATLCGQSPRRSGRRDSRFTLCRAELHILDTLLSIPSLLLAIIVVAFYAGPHLSRCLPSGWPCCREWYVPSL